MADKFFMTKEGLEAAKKQLDYLTRVKRAEIVERIQEARSHGDLSENAEYDAARNEQAANEGEISENIKSAMRKSSRRTTINRSCTSAPL